MGKPQHIGEILSQLMARHGFARVQGIAGWDAAWKQAAGDQIAPQTRVGPFKGGVLQVVVGSSTLMQELTYIKSKLLTRLAELRPQDSIKDLKFRVGKIA